MVNILERQRLSPGSRDMLGQVHEDTEGASKQLSLLRSTDFFPDPSMHSPYIMVAQAEKEWLRSYERKDGSRRLSHVSNDGGCAPHACETNNLTYEGWRPGCGGIEIRQANHFSNWTARLLSLKQREQADIVADGTDGKTDWFLKMVDL